MSLQQWLDNSWVHKVRRSPQVVADLRAVAEREIADASLPGMSPDGKFEHAYDAIRSLSELALHAAGFALPKGGSKHERLIRSLAFTLGAEQAVDVDFFDQCRRKRHVLTYERIGAVQQGDADDLLEAAKALLDRVKRWLQGNHPDLTL